MMSSLLTYLLLTAADPAAAKAVSKAPAAPAACVRPSGPAAGKTAAPVTDGRDEDCDVAIDDVGMPVDKKDKKGKSVLTGASGSTHGMAIDEEGLPVDKKTKKKGIVAGDVSDCDDDGDAACRAAVACGADAKIIVDTYGGHGAHGGQGMAINEQGVQTKPKKRKPAAVAAASSSSSSPGRACPAAAGMAINEKGTAGTVPKKPKSNK